MASQHKNINISLNTECKIQHVTVLEIKYKFGAWYHNARQT